MLKEEPPARPWGEILPQPPVPARLTPPSVCARPTVTLGRKGQTRGTAFGATAFSKAGTQGEQMPTELIHLNCLVPQGLGSPPAVTLLPAPPCLYVSASSTCWPLALPSCASLARPMTPCVWPQARSHVGATAGTVSSGWSIELSHQ